MARKGGADKADARAWRQGDGPQAYREQPIYRMLVGLQLHEALIGCGAITQGQLPVRLEEAEFTSIRTAHLLTTPCNWRSIHDGFAGGRPEPAARRPPCPRRSG